MFLLRGTLAVSAAALLALARVQGRRGAGLAAIAVTAAFATGFAVIAAVDVRESVRNRDDSQRFMDGLAGRLPRRFARVGFAPEIDPALGLRATRDVNDFDLYESPDWAAARTVMTRWWADGAFVGCGSSAVVSHATSCEAAVVALIPQPLLAPVIRQEKGSTQHSHPARLLRRSQRALLATLPSRASLPPPTPAGSPAREEGGG